MAVDGQWDVDELFAVTRRAAPFAELSRRSSTACWTCCRAATRPTSSPSCARESPGTGGSAPSSRARARDAWRSPTAARFRTAACSACSCSARRPAPRASGEFDEEMVFESRVGETFVLGASSWRIEDITHDRVLVSPAPGEPGRMPFWKGDRAGRPLELGLAIGRLMRELLRLSPAAARDRLTREHDLDERAAEQPAPVPPRSSRLPPRRCPTQSTIVVERVRDELGRLARVRPVAPRRPDSRAVGDGGGGERPRGDRASTSTRYGETTGSWCGFQTWIGRPIRGCCCPIPTRSQALVVRQLGATALFAAKFRENAARSLLLPKRRPGMRAPALAAAQARRRPAGGRRAIRIVPGPARDLSRVPARLLRHARARRDAHRPPQPADSRGHRRLRAALAVRRVAALQLRRQLSLRRRRPAGRAPRPGACRRPGAAAASSSATPSFASCSMRPRSTRSSVSCSGSTRSTARGAPTPSTTCCSRSAISPDDELLARGRRRSRRTASARWSAAAVSSRSRSAAGSALHRGRGRARYRDALGVDAALGHPRLAPRTGRDALGDLARRFARTHAPVRRRRVRAGASDCPLTPPKRSSPADSGRRLLEGEFRPGGHASRVDRPRRAAHGRRNRWPSCGARSNRSIRRSSADSPRTGKRIVDADAAPTRSSTSSSSCRGRRSPASILESEILTARIDGYDPADLDSLIAAGEIVWVGVEPLGERDGRIALYLADQPLLPPVGR